MNPMFAIYLEFYHKKDLKIKTALIISELYFKECGILSPFYPHLKIIENGKS